MRILLTTTSFQDTPGMHHDVLVASGFEIVRARGPLSEAQVLDLIRPEGFDGLLCGDDHITSRVIDASSARLRVISKYGIGLDSIDVSHASAKRIAVLFTPGVNETTVAEHTIGLMVALAKQFWPHLRAVKAGEWKRQTGMELFQKTLGILGLGRVAREVVRRARAFGMTCVGHGSHWDDIFASQHELRRCETRHDVLREADVVTLHMSLTPETREFINRDTISQMKSGALLINTARGGLVVEADVAAACRAGRLGGYAADVLVQEPIVPPHVFQEIDNIIVTPHIGSRTNESVERQGMHAAMNLVNYLNGNPDYVQANR
jgi:D-3-phosphoglycerate dehydrogenase